MHSGLHLEIKLLNVICLAFGFELYPKGFHKTTTRDFLLKHVQQEWNMPVRVVAEMKFDLPQTYKFHKQRSVDIAVDLIRVDVSNSVLSTVQSPLSHAAASTVSNEQTMEVCEQQELLDDVEGEKER